MPVTPEQYEGMVRYRAAALALAQALRGRIGEDAWAHVAELIEVNEAPIGLSILAHAIDQLHGSVVAEHERQQLFDLVHPTEEIEYLPESFRTMTPSPEAWWLRRDPGS